MGIKPTQAMNIELLALIDAGVISAPTPVRGPRLYPEIAAELLPDATFRWREMVFHSPSVAAGEIVTRSTGTTSPGRRYLSVNGWKFWHLETPSGLRSLAELRDDNKLQKR